MHLNFPFTWNKLKFTVLLSNCIIRTVDKSRVLPSYLPFSKVCVDEGRETQTQNAQPKITNITGN